MSICVSREMRPLVEVRVAVPATISAVRSAAFPTMVPYESMVTVPVAPLLMSPTVVPPPNVGLPTFSATVPPAGRITEGTSRPSSSRTSSEALGAVSCAWSARAFV